MGDLFSFVAACRADDFSLRPLCDVDRLIFAQLSYCDFLPAMSFAPCPTSACARTCCFHSGARWPKAQEFCFPKPKSLE